jgi:hypothetical protein
MNFIKQKRKERIKNHKKTWIINFKCKLEQFIIKFSKCFNSISAISNCRKMGLSPHKKFSCYIKLLSTCCCKIYQQEHQSKINPVELITIIIIKAISKTVTWMTATLSHVLIAKTIKIIFKNFRMKSDNILE